MVSLGKPGKCSQWNLLVDADVVQNEFNARHLGVLVLMKKICSTQKCVAEYFYKCHAT